MAGERPKSYPRDLAKERDFLTIATVKEPVELFVVPDTHTAQFHNEVAAA